MNTQVTETLQSPIDAEVVGHAIHASGLSSVGRASIRELVKLINEIEQQTGETYVRMEMGVPGLRPPEVGINAEIEALKAGVAAKYPMLDGLPILKQEISKFCKSFMDVEVTPRSCLPTVGSMQGAIATFMVANRTRRERGGTLFIDPGFPVQKKQLQVLGQSYGSFDVYNHRGAKLLDALERHLKEGSYNSILYSNPNNPSWICFTDQELQIIGELADKYDVIVIEDLAYFGMDFRQNYGVPGQAPYQPTVAKYTENYVFLISSSKAFSYAGQRIGSLVISDKLFEREFDDLEPWYNSRQYGYSSIFGALYALSSGVSHSAQYGLAAMLKAANEGRFDFVREVSVYGTRAKQMKQLFIENGFNIVYDKDDTVPLADGFYFTFSYPGMSGETLLKKLIYFGISAIALETTGSERTEGLRACVSQVDDTQLIDLESRLQQFNSRFGD